MRRITKIVTGLSVLAFLAACGGGVKPPEWVTKGSGAFPGDQGAVLYGVGVASKSPNIALQRKIADNRARQELAAQISTYVATFMKDFMEQHKDYFNPDAAGSDELVQFVSKSVSEATLVGSQIVDRWTDPRDGTLYSLAVLRVDDVLNQIKEKTKQAIRAQHRAVVVEKANELVKELDKAVEQKRQYESGVVQ